MMKRFILASLLLHALLMLGWPALRMQQPASLSLQTLHVQLQAASTPVPVTDHHNQPPAPRPEAAVPVHNTPQPPVMPSEAVTEVVAENHRDTRLPEASAGEPVVADTPVHDDATALSNVRAALYSALQANFRYPHRARLRGWEGTVVIALRILPDGAVTDVRVSNSSGIRVLDDAALHSLRTVQVPDAVAWMNGHDLAMLIPVEYRLTDS